MKIILAIIPLVILGVVGSSESFADETTIDANVSVTQQTLKVMVENWMTNPDEDDTNQRLEIMKAYYTFEETGQKLSNDREGLVLMNQIRKMVSLDIPKAELDQIRNQVRIGLGLENLAENIVLYVDSRLVDCIGVGKQKCMQVREDEGAQWRNFYGSIEGFDFQPGNAYKLSLKVTDIENPPADSSSKKFTLIKIIEKKSFSKHVPYKNTCAPGFTPLGEICVLDDRCGPGAYPGKICVMNGNEKPYLRPSQQGNAGIIASNVICKEDLNLIFKSHNGYPACVSDSSLQKLENRGWQTNLPVFACTEDFAPVCGVDGVTYGNKCALDANHIPLKNTGECSSVMEETAGIFEKTWEYTKSPATFGEKGYFVTEISDGVYWLAGSGYQTMFLVTGQGVVAIDAPKPIGEKYLDAISEVTDEPITHMIYSHHHQDHTGSAGIFPEDITYIAHKDAADLLVSENDPFRPIPNMILEGNFNTLEIGDHVIEFHNVGDFHSKGNLLILLPQNKVGMLVDLFRPDESPYRAFGVTPDIDLYLKTHDVLQTFDFDVLVTGHTNLLATKDHIITNKEFTQSVMDNAQAALESVEPNPVEVCSVTTIEQWQGILGNLGEFMNDHCTTMIKYLQSK